MKSEPTTCFPDQNSHARQDAIVGHTPTAACLAQDGIVDLQFAFMTN